MNKFPIKPSSSLNTYTGKDIMEYDCICIGTSMIIALEACYQAGKGHTVLMVDKDKTFGGAWKTITIDGVKDVENAIHYFLPDEKGIEFLRKSLDFSVEPSKGKYRYFKPFNLLSIKLPYSSWVGRFFHKVSHSNFEKSFFTNLRHVYSTALSAFHERGERSYYTSLGCAEMLEKVQTRIRNEGVDIWYQSEIVNIYFDIEEKRVFCEVGGKTVIARSLILGHGARLPKLKSSKGSLVLEEKFHPRPAFHLVVEDKMQSQVREVVMNSDPIIKYVHDVTRFSSLRYANQENKKIFVFALHPNIQNHDALAGKLYEKLKEIKLISQNSRVVESLYSDVILPTIYDEDLYKMKDYFGDLVNILRTENFTRGIGYYAERWKT